MIKISLTVALLFYAFPSFAVQQPPDDKVVVTANAYPVAFENLSRTVTVLTREDIDRLPVRSIADVLTQVSAVDLRTRSPFGLQTDLSIRGSAYSQVLVLVDGVRINDSQTAHHNSDFPVQLQDVERIEVLLGPGSSIYGADAFGGIINIITRRDLERIRASVSAGQNGLFEASASTGFAAGNITQRISVTGNRSAGFEYDREFRTLAISSRTGIGNRSSVFVSHIDKEFGANGFYGPSPSKEWTDQTLVSFEHRPGNESILHGYYRTHSDRFIYDIRSPGMFESRHRTHSAGMLAKTRLQSWSDGYVTIGGEAGGDWIRSNTLGRHEFLRASVFAELQQNLGDDAVVYPGIRLDYYSSFGTAVNPTLSGSWWVRPRIRLRSSVGRAFRIPTFTELYYRDPNNEASPTLKPESSWAADAGADFVPARNWMASVTVFARRESNVIDWIRETAAQKWRSSNLRRLRTAGIEIGLEHSLGETAGFSARYSRISANAGSVGFISKYVLDYARDSWSASTYFPIPLSFLYRQTLNYKRRADGRDYCILDSRLERHIGRFTASVDFTNLLNSRYQEVSGVNMPGRWFVVTLRTR